MNWDSDLLISAVSPEQAKKHGLRFYPYPSSGIVHLEMNLSEGILYPNSLIVFDLLGRMVFPKALKEHAQKEIVDVSILFKGMCIVQFYHDERPIAWERLVVMK